MQLTFEITEILVLTGDGPDKIIVKTTLPEPCWPYEGGMFFNIKAAAGTGEDYVKSNFGVEPEVIKKFLSRIKV